MAFLGYARVSTNQQDLSPQRARLKAAGVRDTEDFMFCDRASGKDCDRPALNMLLTKAREGDTVLITKLDRLGRNTADMISIIEKLNSKNVYLRFLDDGISTEGSMGKMVITILAAVAQAESERILERTNEGRRAAISKGVKMGRKPKVTISLQNQIIDLVEKGISKSQIASTFNVSRQTIYNVINTNNLQPVSKYQI